MVNHSREKVALAVFLVLVIGGFAGLASYLAVGHTWNVAASNIDDATGSMEGYTAIIFKGLTPKTTADTQKKTLQSGTSASAPNTNTEPNSSSTDAGSSASASASKDTASPSSSSSSSIGAGGTANKTNGLTSIKTPLSLDDVQKSYEEKKATVLTVNVDNLAYYNDGLILRKGNQRFGIFSISSTDSLEKIDAQIAYFKRYKVDFIVAVVPEKRLATSVSGIDIVISTANEGLFIMGETINGTFYVGSPQVESVGVILVSPSRVVSAKVLQEL